MNTPAQRAPKKRRGLLPVLLILLAAAAAALAYDRWARARSEAAYAAVLEMVEAIGEANRSPATDADVRREIGPPSERQEYEYYYLDLYRWPRGLPWNSYVVYVVYAKGPPVLLHNATLNEPPDDDVVPLKPDGPLPPRE